MIDSVTNVAPAAAGWFDPGQARQREAQYQGQYTWFNFFIGD